jgi:hypothetical protein
MDLSDLGKIHLDVTVYEASLIKEGLMVNAAAVDIL